MFAIFLMLFLVCYESTQNLMRPEGSECTYNGAIGQCVSVFKCVSAVEDIAKKIYPPVCSFAGITPIICCTDCELVDDTRLLLFNPLLGTLTKTGTRKAKDKCLDYINTLDYPCKRNLVPKNISRVFDDEKKCFFTIDVQNGGAAFATGGKNAQREEFPHMALLGYGDTLDSAAWLCGGTVISERFILTAAHCLASRTTGPVKYIAVGILKRSDPAELWERYNVQRAIYHPEYKAPSKYNDIALIETDKEISFSSKVLPACVHVSDKMDRFAYATGWGALGRNRGLADVLQSVFLRQFTDQQCSELYPIHRNLANGYDSASQVCYGDSLDNVVPTDTCEGDSGGPLQSQDHAPCVYTILGVTSYGRPCGGSGSAGVYTRVNNYVPWIESIVWP